MINKKNNKGFSLVEVIVSMLVLSIVISSVLTAFSLSTKANAKTKKVQSAESLMEDLVELAGAVKDSSQFVSYCTSTYMLPMPSPEPSANPDIEVHTITGIQHGSYTYTVEVTRDMKPDAYTNMNSKPVLSFGESDSRAVLVDASLNGTKFDEADDDSYYDLTALSTFTTLHTIEVDQRNATLATPIPTKTEDEVVAIIDRDILLVAEPVGTDQMQLVAYYSYQVPETDAEFVYPATEERVLEMEFYRSVEYDRASEGTDTEEKLDRIYLLYSPWAGEVVDEHDVRIWDPAGILDAEVYLILQEEEKEVVDVFADDLADDLSTRFYGKAIKVYFAQRGEVETAPQMVELYCPGEIIWTAGVDNTKVKTHSYTMVPVRDEIRVQTIKIVIKDSDGNELGNKTVTCLQ